MTFAEDRAILAISGADRLTFLQGLVSNDVMRLLDGRAIHAAFLTAQGKYLHDFALVGLGDRVLLEGEKGRLDDLKRRLGLYRLRAQVSLEMLPDWQVVLVWPDTSVLGLEGDAGTARPMFGGTGFIDPRLASLGARLLVPATAELPALEHRPMADYARHRIALGVPEGSTDLPVEKAILLENGFDELNGVDWTKGCYIGQELTARTKYRGLVKKRLVPVTIEGPTPQPGTPILTVDGKDAGETRGAVDGIGLALVRLEHLESELTADGARLVPAKPAWAQF